MESFIEEFKDPNREKKSELVITVDGPSGSGKGTLAKQIKEMLDIKHFSASDIFYQVCEERGWTENKLSEKAEKEVDLEIDQETLTRGLNQDCVIEGRIPGWVLGTYADLRIYLGAEPGERYARIAERENTTVPEAKEKTQKRDEDNQKRYRKYYGIDTNNLEHYDLIIDNTDLEPHEQIELVEKALDERGII